MVECEHFLEESQEEIKRFEHIAYVSLKYTRSSDMLMNGINRLIQAYEYQVDSLLAFAELKDEFLEIPPSPVQKANLVLKLFKDQIIIDNMTIYLKLRKIARMKYSSREEFRRHVTATFIVDDEEFEVNINLIEEYYSIIKSFQRYLVDLIVRDKVNMKKGDY